tara:strand:+ start:3894 stop:4079 length:186 start_codon:yes stop_codon:yes gene_type:complete
MKAYIYNVDTNEVIATIEGEDNDSIESKADDLNYMGVDEYGLSYTCFDLIISSDTEEHRVI